MKGIRSLFRLGALAMIAVLLVVALTVPAAAADEICRDKQMLDEVQIVSVTPHESARTWVASELLSYGNGAAGAYPTGQLEVRFRDINTAHTITHYDVIATPSDEPGTSEELGIDEVTVEVDRPRDVGSLVITTLDLEPGTNYDIDVVANFYSVQISPNQSDQDSLGGTTFLSPPFLGGGVSLGSMDLASPSPANRGVHYLVYRANQELHTLRWLNPKLYGPFDHRWKKSASGNGTDGVSGFSVDPDVGDWEGADILCTSNDGGDLQDDCKDDDGVGISHYRVTVTDDRGNVEYREMVEVYAESTSPPPDVYSVDFNLNDGTYTFAVDAGYLDDGKFYPLSDKGQVEFDIPDDYRRYNQDQAEVTGLLDDIVNDVAGEEDDFDAFYDSDWNYPDFNGSGTSVVKSDASSLTPVTLTTTGYIPADPSAPTQGERDAVTTENTRRAGLVRENRQEALTIYLNNLYN